MAFVQGELSLMGYTGAAATGHHFYFYANTAADTITAANFFNATADQIVNGDLLYLVNAGTFNRLTVSAGVVTVDPLTVNAV